MKFIFNSGLSGTVEAESCVGVFVGNSVLQLKHKCGCLLMRMQMQALWNGGSLSIATLTAAFALLNAITVNLVVIHMHVDQMNHLCITLKEAPRNGSLQFIVVELIFLLFCIADSLNGAF